MYSLDQNLNVALDRQAEHVRAVQAVGLSQTSQPAAQTRPEPSLVAGVIATLLAAVALIGTVSGRLRSPSN